MSKLDKYELSTIEKAMALCDVDNEEQLRELVEAEDIGCERHLMDALKRAIEQWEQPPRSRVKAILEQTYNVEIQIHKFMRFGID